MLEVEHKTKEQEFSSHAEMRRLAHFAMAKQSRIDDSWRRIRQATRRRRVLWGLQLAVLTGFCFSILMALAVGA